MILPISSQYNNRPRPFSITCATSLLQKYGVLRRLELQLDTSFYVRHTSVAAVKQTERLSSVDRGINKGCDSSSNVVYYAQLMLLALCDVISINLYCCIIFCG